MRLRPRDVEILRAVVVMRAVRTSDLCRLFFRAKGTAQKRLRRLFDTGLVRVISADLAVESRYVVTRTGYEVLALASDDPVPPFRSPPRVDARHIGHHDLLVSYWTSLAVGCARHAVALEQFRPEWELRAEVPDAALVSDGILIVQHKGTRIALALECDTGTERAAIILRKIERYDAIEVAGSSLFGVRPDAVLFVTSTERRARRLAAHLHGRCTVPVLFGAVPLVLVDGGLTTGLASARELVEEAASGDNFANGLLTGVE